HGEDAIPRHQGIDIAWGHAGASIVSVCDGVVEKAARVYESGVGGYGRTIVIRGEETGEPRWYLYAHCKTIDASVEVGRDVRAGQVIGTVGLSDTAGKFIFDPKNENGAHLHFEVSASKYWKKQYIEESNQNHFVPGATPPARARLDPLAELARLGPWGMTRVFMPNAELSSNVSGSGGPSTSKINFRPLEVDHVTRLHGEIELSSRGGYFPLGANNDWHGGVHLPAPSSSTIVAPFDADIVAFRLDADPVKSLTDAGHTNFILLRHKMAETAARMFVGKPPLEPAPGKKAKPPSVGRDGTNEPDLVIKVKSGLAQRLKDGTPIYHPADPLQTLDPTADEELYQAIETFQRTLAPPKAKKKKKKPPPPWPDGLMTVNGYSWISLFGAPTKEKAEPTTPAEGPKDEPGVPTKDGGDPQTHEPTAPAPGDREPRVYSLLMHLGPHAFDASAVKRFPWLGRATMVPREEDESERAAARKREEREADRNEAQHTLKRRVGFPPVPEDLDDIGSADIDPGDTDDIRWVQQRLRRLAGYAGEADGTWVEDMRPVIIEFQRAHTKYFKKHLDEAQGYVMPKGQTYKALKRTAVDLFGGEDDPAVDEVLRLRASERDTPGHVRVVSGLKIPVKSGEPLWIPGPAEGVIPDV
ncbi:MAG: peptidoglycan DD-metalloendopeptidase family protein, partial [Nannocystaceae bacterium]